MTNEIKKRMKSADDVAAEYLELQFSMKKESRLANVLTIVLTLGFIYTFAVLFWVLPDKAKSESENRMLATAPSFEMEGFLHGDFTSEFGTYMADQFPFRDWFIGVYATSETLQGKGETNDVILGDDGYLFARNDFPDKVRDPEDETKIYNYLESNLKSVSNFIAAAKDKGITCIPSFAGRKIDVLEKYLPKTYGTYYSDRIWNMLEDYCREGGFEPLNLRDALSEIAKESDEQLYYRTDHHWTTLGAYYAYCEIIKALGETPYALSDFEKETVTEDFFGTTWSSAGTPWTDGDKIEYFRYEDDGEYTMKILGKIADFEGYEGCTYETDESGKNYTVFNSFYVREFLSEKDKYASFLGGNYGYTEIRKNTDEERETLLVLKDSFSHSVAPLLARHYDLIMVDLRYYKTPILRFCMTNEIDKVLFLYNMETLTEADYLKVLNAGLGVK